VLFCPLHGYGNFYNIMICGVEVFAKRCTHL
jgi:hypothetical protein